MGSPIISDFNLNSKGHCFFCLKKILVKVKRDPELMGTSQYSVHYLACYLKMDMGRVFNDQRQIDSSLLTKVRRSRLKVELCEKCTRLNETFSELYQQLEKLEWEINSSLGLIRQELLGTGNPPILCSSSTRRDEVSQIVDVLREEAIQKCCQKLVLVLPRVKIDKLTKKQIDAELSKHKTDPGITEMDPETSSPTESIEFEGNIKTEFEPPIENLFLEDDTRNYDMDSDSVAMDEDPTNISEDPWGSDSANNNLRTGTADNKNSLVIISTPFTSKTKVGTLKYIMNTETRKWKCSACPTEFTTKPAVNRHYKSVHENVRFGCAPCGKDFSQQCHYNRHHQSVHVGVKFKCLVCNKLFTRKDALGLHQRTGGCEMETNRLN